MVVLGCVLGALLVAPGATAGAAPAGLSVGARHQIVGAFEAASPIRLGAVPPAAVQAYDPAMATLLQEVATWFESGYEDTTFSVSLTSVRLAAPGVASAQLTVTARPRTSPASSVAYLVTAVRSNGRWRVSWATQCLFVETAGLSCPPTPRGVSGTVPLPRRLSPATPDAGLVEPGALAVAPDGSLLIVDIGRDQILRRSSSGALSVMAGTGFSGFSGDGGPATGAALDLESGSSLAVGPGGTVYVSDTGNGRVRAISPQGIITTVAGDGSAENSGDGGPAVDAGLQQPTGLAVSPGGVLYVACQSAVRAVDADGIIRTVLAGGAPSGNDIVASGSVVAFFPDLLALDGAGDLDVSSWSPALLLQLPGGPAGPTGADVSVLAPGRTNGLATAPDGTVMVAEHGGGLAEVAAGRLLPILGALAPVSGFTGRSDPDGFIDPAGVAVGPDGTLYADTDGGDGYADLVRLVGLPPHGSAGVIALTNGPIGSLPAVGAPGFSAAVLPPPVPARRGDGVTSCPSSSGLVPFTKRAISTARREAQGWGSNFFLSLQESDRSFWAALVSVLPGGDLAGRHNTGPIASAGADLAEPSIEAACGAALVRRSIVVPLRRSAYSSATVHLFFLDRRGTPLVYFVGL